MVSGSGYERSSRIGVTGLEEARGVLFWKRTLVALATFGGVCSENSVLLMAGVVDGSVTVMLGAELPAEPRSDQFVPTLAVSLISASLVLRRLIVLCLRLRVERDLLVPRLYDEAAEAKLESEGRLACDDVSEVSEAVELQAEDVVSEEGNLTRDCGLPCGVSVPGESPFSVVAAQARKTVSRIDGVKSDSVRCDSVKAASRSIFFCENEACISFGLSSENSEVSLSSIVPPSIGFCGGLANGSTG